MAKIPDARNQRRAAAQPSRAIADPAIAARGLQEAANIQSGAANNVAQLAQVGTEVSTAFADAEVRIRTRDDAVARARAVSAYTEQSAEELRRIRTEEDLSDRNVAGAYISSLRENAARIATEHGGSEASRAALAVRLEGIRTEYTNQASGARLEAQNALVTDTMSSALSNITTTAYQTPSQFNSLIESWDAQVDDMAPALTVQQELDLRRNGRQQIVVSSVERFLDEGDFRSARRFLRETPVSGNVLTPDQQRQLGARILTAEQAALTSGGLNEGREKLNELRGALGREPTEDEVKDYLGIGGDRPPTVEQLQTSRDTAVAEGRIEDASQIQDLITKMGTVVGRTPEDVAATPEGFSEAISTFTGEDVERLRTNLRTNQEQFDTAATTLSAVQEAGSFAVGFKGAATEGFTGIAENLGPLGEGINAAMEELTGADLEKVNTARTRLREGISGLLEEITGEESGRFSEPERKLAFETLRGLGPTSGIEQVTDAFLTFLQVVNESDVRNAREISIGMGLQLGTIEELNEPNVDALANALRRNGMAEARIPEVLHQLITGQQLSALSFRRPE